MRPTVLVLTPHAGRTGASLLLLQFLRWARAHTDISFRIVIERDGAVAADFMALGPTLILSGGGDDGLARKIVRRLSGANERATVLRRFCEDHPVSLIYSNTVCNGELLRSLQFLNA